MRIDQSHLEMIELLRAVYPRVAQINWAEYCGSNVPSLDDEGVPQYTGVLLHRSAPKEVIGNSTVVAGSLMCPAQIAKMAKRMAVALNDDRTAQTSLEHRRSPVGTLWGGAVRTSDSKSVV